MIFTFENLPIKGKEDLRQRILELFGRDIATVSSSFSTRNYAFIFSEGCFPAILRLSEETAHRTAEGVLSELMWLDDLKNDVANVCQPLPSQKNRMVERILIGEKLYRVTMFRKANGDLLPDTAWDKTYFYNAGALLGKIHRTSYEGYERGFRYKRHNWDERADLDFAAFDNYFDPSARKKAEAVLTKIKNLPRDSRWYGMIHGDYQNGNLFCDWGNLWAFDFDDCCYGPFMIDIASFAHVCIHSVNYAGLHPNVTAHDRMFGDNGILTHFRSGYSSEHLLPDEQWELFDDYFRLTVAIVLGFQIAHQILPANIIVALNQPMLAYLETDKPPVNRVDEVVQETIASLTPEQLQIIAENTMA